MCLDFVNLPFSPGDPVERAVDWPELIEFLTQNGIVTSERRQQLAELPESDLAASTNLLHSANQLMSSVRLAVRAVIRGSRVHREWVESINAILRITEGHDELEWDGERWRLGFLAQHEALEWLLAAVARSAAELIAAGANSGVKQCANPNCHLLFCDDSRTHRRRWCSMALCGNRSKVAAFARRHSHGGGRAHAQHA